MNSETERSKVGRTGNSEGALVRIGAGTAGGAAVGAAIGTLLGIPGNGVGAAVGGVIGFVASTTDAIKTKSDDQ